MQRKKILIIANPVAGIQQKQINKIKRAILLKKEKKIEEEVKEFFIKKGYRAELTHTKKENKEKLFLEKNKAKIIIIIGGDGTINKVINNLSNFKQKIGLIPTGTENMTAKELGIPINVKKACKIIEKGKTKKIDIGITNDKKFIFVAGIGFDAHAITNLKKTVKKLIGKHSYVLAGLKTLFEHKAEELDITINKRKKTKGYFALVTNIKKYGGKIKISQKAELDDGHLDLCVFKKKNIFGVIKYIYKAATGEMTSLKEIEHHQIKSAEIKSKNKVLFHTDAEIGGSTPVKISVLPRKLEVFVP